MKPKNVPKDCIDHSRSDPISAADDKVEIKFSNPDAHNVEKVRVDGCAIKEGAKCDWLIVCRDLSICHFVELKSKSNVEHGHTQLKSSISHPVIKSFIGGLKRRCWLVTSQRHPNSPELQQLKRHYKKDYQSQFSYVERGAKLSLS